MCKPRKPSVLGDIRVQSANIMYSEYSKVPKHLKDDNVMPSISEIPSLLNSIRHPSRSRSISVGPQSEADAYETLAYRDKHRRQSKSETTATAPKIDKPDRVRKEPPDYFSMSASNIPSNRPLALGLPTPVSSDQDLYKSMTEAEAALYTPLTPGLTVVGSTSSSRRPSAERRQDEKEEREMFSKLEKPRVRYDVEVVSKLIVYTGIAWISVEGAPLLFEIIGLGIDRQPG